MADFLESATTWLNGICRSQISQSVRYRRGAEYVDLVATVGQVPIDSRSGQGVLQNWKRRDYLIDRSDLLLDGIAIEPEMGDWIEQTLNGETHVFQVLNNDDGRCFDTDASGGMLRIYTKEILGD